MMTRSQTLTSGNVRAIAKRHPLATFFALACGLEWLATPLAFVTPELPPFVVRGEFAYHCDGCSVASVCDGDIRCCGHGQRSCDLAHGGPERDVSE